jgi:hypothetical protein
MLSWWDGGRRDGAFEPFLLIVTDRDSSGKLQMLSKIGVKDYSKK